MPVSLWKPKSDWPQKTFSDEQEANGGKSMRILEQNLRRGTNQPHFSKIIHFPNILLLYSKNILGRCSTSLSSKMQIKTTRRYHLTPIRMAIIKKKPTRTRNDKCWWGCGERETLLHYWLKCKLVQPLWRTVCQFHKKLKV